jgi:hypothetical protein
LSGKRLSFFKPFHYPWAKYDDFVKSHQMCFRWLSKNFDKQGAVIFQVRDNTYGMSSALNLEFAVAIYYGLKILAATIVSRFCSST